MILIMRPLARAAHNQEKCCITGYICGNCGQECFEPKQYRVDKRRLFSWLLCVDFKDFKWCLIAISVEEDELFISASVLLLCIPVQ